MVMTSDPATSLKTFVRAFAVFSAIWIALLLVFNRMPSIDVHTSSLFFTNSLCVPATVKTSCGYFGLSEMRAVRSLRSYLFDLPYLAAGLVLAAIIACYISPAWKARLPLSRLWLSLISLGISTGILTNLILKGHSGRPRPVHADLFGGPMQFMPAGSFDGACQSNCSFVSGEASGAGWLICLVFLLPPRIRDWVGPPLVLASAVTIFLRVAVGAHFLSDVLLGWLLSVVVFCGVMAVEAKFRSRISSAC